MSSSSKESRHSDPVSDSSNFEEAMTVKDMDADKNIAPCSKVEAWLSDQPFICGNVSQNLCLTQEENLTVPEQHQEISEQQMVSDFWSKVKDLVEAAVRKCLRGDLRLHPGTRQGHRCFKDFPFGISTTLSSEPTGEFLSQSSGGIVSQNSNLAQENNMSVAESNQDGSDFWYQMRDMVEAAVLESLLSDAHLHPLAIWLEFKDVCPHAFEHFNADDHNSIVSRASFVKSDDVAEIVTKEEKCSDDKTSSMLSHSDSPFGKADMSGRRFFNDLPSGSSTTLSSEPASEFSSQYPDSIESYASASNLGRRFFDDLPSSSSTTLSSEPTGEFSSQYSDSIVSQNSNLTQEDTIVPESDQGSSDSWSQMRVQAEAAIYESSLSDLHPHAGSSQVDDDSSIESSTNILGSDVVSEIAAEEERCSDGSTSTLLCHSNSPFPVADISGRVFFNDLPSGSSAILSSKPIGEVPYQCSDCIASQNSEFSQRNVIVLTQEQKRACFWAMLKSIIKVAFDEAAAGNLSLSPPPGRSWFEAKNVNDLRLEQREDVLEDLSPTESNISQDVKEAPSDDDDQSFISCCSHKTLYASSTGVSLESFSESSTIAEFFREKESSYEISQEDDDESGFQKTQGGEDQERPSLQRQESSLTLDEGFGHRVIEGIEKLDGNPPSGRNC